MSDAQLQRRATIKKRLIISCVLIVLSLGLLYFRFSTDAEYNTYKTQKAQEVGYQQQVDSLTMANAQLLQTIEENGKQLVSFSENKIMYINLASELALNHSVRINRLTVSDVWNEGEMSGMTTAIEVEGALSDVRSFVEEYCGTEYTNRISVVSCRPSGRYAWLTRTIDDQQVLQWFDLGEDNRLFQAQDLETRIQMQQQGASGDLSMATEDGTTDPNSYTYNEETGEFVYNGTDVTVSQDVLDETPITLDKMFSTKSMKVYLVIDFLGRA